MGVCMFVCVYGVVGVMRGMSLLMHISPYSNPTDQRHTNERLMQSRRHTHAHGDA